MKTIAVINQKGGVGKSTTAMALGAGLHFKNKKVLFVDLDAQGNLSYTLGAKTNGFNVMGVLQNPQTVMDEIQHINLGDVLASSAFLSGADTIITQTGKEYRLKEAFSAIEHLYDFAIIDTPPALGVLTVNALTACDGVIIPSQADIYSLQGISQLNNTIETVKKYCNNKLKILGIVLIRYNSRAVISREVAETIGKTAKGLNTKLYNSKIRECTAIKEAQAVKQDIYTYAPKSNAALDYQKLLDEILLEEI